MVVYTHCASSLYALRSVMERKHMCKCHISVNATNIH